MNHHPVISPPGRCLACEGGERQGDPLVCPMGQSHRAIHGFIRGAGETGMRPKKGDAVAALMVMGIKNGVKLAEDFGKIGGE